MGEFRALSELRLVKYQNLDFSEPNTTPKKLRLAWISLFNEMWVKFELLEHQASLI